MCVCVCVCVYSLGVGCDGEGEKGEEERVVRGALHSTALGVQAIHQSQALSKETHVQYIAP